MSCTQDDSIVREQNANLQEPISTDNPVALEFQRRGIAQRIVPPYSLGKPKGPDQITTSAQNHDSFEDADWKTFEQEYGSVDFTNLFVMDSSNTGTVFPLFSKANNKLIGWLSGFYNSDNIIEYWVKPVQSNIVLGDNATLSYIIKDEAQKENATTQAQTTTAFHGQTTSASFGEFCRPKSVTLCVGKLGDPEDFYSDDINEEDLECTTYIDGIDCDEAHIDRDGGGGSSFGDQDSGEDENGDNNHTGDREGTGNRGDTDGWERVGQELDCTGGKVPNRAGDACECPGKKQEDASGNCECPEGMVEDVDGNCTEKPCLGDPVPNPEIVSSGPSGKKGGTFGCTRSNAKTSCGGVKGSKRHDGLDIKADVNTNAHSTHTGTVTAIRNTFSAGEYKEDSFGNFVVVTFVVDGATRNIKYNHLNKVSVKVGDTVDAGDLIGLAGNTGNAAGKNVTPHIHIQVFNSDWTEKFDPLEFITTKFDSEFNPMSNDCN